METRPNQAQSRLLACLNAFTPQARTDSQEQSKTVLQRTGDLRVSLGDCERLSKSIGSVMVEHGRYSKNCGRTRSRPEYLLDELSTRSAAGD